MVWRASDPEGNEAGKVKYLIVPFTRGRVLDLGCGPNKAFPHFIGVDNKKDTELFGIAMRPELTVDVTNLQDSIQDESVDAIFSSHLLEHIEDYRAALASWWACIKPGGHLVLYLPHRDLYPNIGQPHANPDHKHDFVPEDITMAMATVGNPAGWDLLVSEVRDQGTEYSFLQVYRKRADNTQVLSYRAPRPAKTACVVRYGGFGDMLQAANVLPALKRQGYHVTVMTTPKGQDILKEDPFVDAWFIQDGDQVPNDELGAFWKVQAGRFDKFVNLSESVEGTLLAYPGRSNHAWPASVRRKHLGTVNYLEFVNDLAELPYRSESRFYPSREESAAVDRFTSKVRRRAAGVEGMAGPVAAPPVFTIMFALAGSSIHKMYPHMDTVIAKVLAMAPNAVFVLVGDEVCRMLESGWEDNPRVWCTSGKLGIRETLALAQAMDCVLGPETGVLNAVAFEPMAKVCILSHSSKDNLTKHWVNTDAIEPSTACFPCHQLHHDRTFCPEHEPSGAAQCAWDVQPDRVVAPIARAYAEWEQLRTLRRAA
jgi:ADP-heptose:LPS heptosyltransferase/SAM-dependent methyltransferase